MRISRSALISTLLLAGCAPTHADCYDASAGAFNKARALYRAKDYAASSKLFESTARGRASCFQAQGIPKVEDMEAVALDLLTAGEAAHWAHDDARALILVKEAQSQLKAIHSANVDTNFELSGDDEQAKSDLSGTWTLGVRE